MTPELEAPLRFARRAVRRAGREIRLYATDPWRRLYVNAQLARPVRKAQFGHLGRHVVLHRPDWLIGTRNMWIGDNAVILNSCWLSVELPKRATREIVLRIGDRCWLRPYVVISAAESIVIEDDVVIAAFTSIIDSDHTFAAGRPSVAENPVVTSPIRIGRGTWVAERCAILRGADIGQSCIIGANSVVRGRIPDYSIAVGAPARVVGSTRASFADAPDGAE